MLNKYVHWLHGQWPAGLVEKLPEVNDDGSTNVPGLYVVGDLTGIPLLKFSADTGTRVIRTIAEDSSFRDLQGKDDNVVDVVIIGGGVGGMAAAVECKGQGLSFNLLEASEPFSTIVNFPKRKPIYTYPTDMTPAGDLQVSADVKEALVDELRSQMESHGIEPTIARATKVKRSGKYLEVELAQGEALKARRVVIAIGRSGDYRKLGIVGEELPKVYNRLHDPKDYCEQNVLVVGGGDSALETAIAIAECGSEPGKVTLAYRKAEFSRPKPENQDKLDALKTKGRVRVLMSTQPLEVREGEVELQTPEGKETLPNDSVFAMIGRKPPLEFLRASGINITGDWNPKTWLSFGTFFAFCFFVYLWKGGTPLKSYFVEKGWFPFNVPDAMKALSASAGDPSTLLGTLSISFKDPGFYYSLAYTLGVVVFGVRRVRRRKTPYVKLQTWSLGTVQVLPLFLLPYVILPLLGHNGAFDGGFGQTFADALFPMADYDHGREYWRAFGFILAWPLFIWNFFTGEPLWAWLAIGFVQTFVIIPAMIYFWGKGAYCGWICSCGALAETVGDTHRQKMPHGPIWNRVNMIGQVFLVAAFALLLSRIISWVAPGSSIGQATQTFYNGFLSGWGVLSYYYIVDIFFAGIVGVGFYFWFSGRVWCRFACPLAALMHIYARFTSFRILADKKKCISCNVCTSVCHQGIDVMSFANKGRPMEDPECVRCSACVSSCPTGTLSFGRIDRNSGDVIGVDSLKASLVQIGEHRTPSP